MPKFQYPSREELAEDYRDLESRALARGDVRQAIKHSLAAARLEIDPTSPPTLAKMKLLLLVDDVAGAIEVSKRLSGIR